MRIIYLAAMVPAIVVDWFGIYLVLHSAAGSVDPLGILLVALGVFAWFALWALLLVEIFKTPPGVEKEIRNTTTTRVVGLAATAVMVVVSYVALLRHPVIAFGAAIPLVMVAVAVLNLAMTIRVKAGSNLA